MLRQPILGEMGLSDFSWVILDYDVQWTHRRPGDVDIIGGALCWRTVDCLESSFHELSRAYPHWHESLHSQLAGKHAAEAGGIAWPPSCDNLFGIEAKCALVRNGAAQSAKPFPEDVAMLREQVNGLTLLGLDRVALLDVVATEPSDGENLFAWLAAHNTAEEALAAMESVLAARLPDYSPAAHIALSPGAVVGADEAFRGAPVCKILRPAQVSCLDGLPDRSRLNTAIRKSLAKLPRPTFFPAVYVQCSACSKIHSLHDESCGFSAEDPRMRAAGGRP